MPAGGDGGHPGANRAGRVVGAVLIMVVAAVGIGCTVSPVIAYPNLRVLVPTDQISIGTPTSTQRTLDFEHITWNAGDGPLEIHPQFDPATGSAKATQALSTLTGTATWSFVRSVPIVKPMTWDPPSDYRFPLTGFTLHTNTASGGVGAVVATSPKVDFCMTPDAFVGGVPNTTPTGVPPPSNCNDPNGVLGLSVGWGDLYDHEDAGNNIDISNLPNGTYWLRAQADPGDYFAQSGPNLSVTDTQLQITGTTVQVLRQVTPTPTRPVVTMRSPVDGASLSGAVTLQASVTDTVSVSGLQFLVDGAPVGPVLTTAPYTLSLPGLSPGSHVVSAQATDVNGYVGTAPGVAVTVPLSVGTIVFDRLASVTGTSAVTAPAVATTAPGEQLVALVGADAASAGQSATVSGGGLSWSLVKRANAQLGDAEIWAAAVPSPRSGLTVGASLAQTGKDLSLTVVAVQNATIGTSAAAGAASGGPSVSFTSTAAGSVGLAVGNDYDNAIARTLGSGQALLSQWVDTGTGDTFWAQHSTAPTTASGQRVTLNDTAPTADRWNLAAVELRPSGSPQASLAADVSAVASSAENSASGPLAVSITSPSAAQRLSGTVSVSASAIGPDPITSVQFALDGLPIGAVVTTPPYETSWNTVTSLNGTHSLTATATDSKGRRVTSSPESVTAANTSVCFVKDVNVNVHGSGPLTTPVFHTATSAELLVALVAYDGSATAAQTATVSGGGLSWHLVKRANGERGDSEIWTATTTGPVSSQVTATPADSSFDGYLQVIAFQGTAGVGASVAGSAPSGSPTVGLATTQPQSLVFSIGNDADAADTPVPGANQAVAGQWVDTAAGVTFWSQGTTLQTGSAGAVATIDDTAPTTDHWNLVAVEVLAANTSAYLS